MPDFSFPATLRLAVCAALVVPLVSCGPRGRDHETPDGKKKIQFLTMQLRPTFDDFFLPLIEEYENQNPDIDIEWVDYPWSGYETKLMTTMLADTAADVVNLPSQSLPGYIRTSTILPLDDHVAPDVMDDYVPSILEACRFDGELYALPWYAVTNVAFYNTDLLREAGLSEDDIPLTYSDLPEYLRTIRDEAGVFGWYPIYTESGALRELLWEAGVPILNEEWTEATFNTPRALEVLTWWADLYHQNLVPTDSVTATHRVLIEQYKIEELVGMKSGPQFIRQFRSNTPEVYDATVVAPLPHWPEVQRYKIDLHTFAVWSGTPWPEEAADFAEFLTNDANQLAFGVRTESVLPSSIEALRDPFYTDPADTLEGRARAITADQTARGAVLATLPNNTAINDVFDAAMEAVLLRNKTPQEALDDAEEEINELLIR